MKNIFLIVCLVLVLFLQAHISLAQKYLDKPGSQYTNRDIIVQNNKLFVNGLEYFVKGMAYSPQPLGILSMDEQGNLGGGFCSVKKTIFDEYKSACFGSDYFDGVRSNARRFPVGPSGSWWQAVWNRDFPVLQELGVNTVRIYNLNPLTKTFLSKYPAEYPNAIAEYAAEHTQFLNRAQIAGMKVILPVVTDQALLANSDNTKLEKFIEAAVDELGNHDALLMWAVSNEIDLIHEPDLLAKVNFAADHLRQYTLQKWNRLIPVTIVVLDHPEDYEFYAQNLRVDVFTTNAGYRSVFFDPLFEGEKDSIGWVAMSQQYNVPLLIGESGMHDNDVETAIRPNWPNQQYKQIIARVNQGCIGIVFFEYSDEPLKPLLQRSMGFVNFTASYDSTKRKYSTESDVWIPDTLHRKPTIFQALKQGLTGDAQFGGYNFNADVWTLVGRQQSTIQVKNVPSPKPSISAASSTSIAVCACILIISIVASLL